MLIVALPEDAGGGLDHALSFRRNRRRDFLELALDHHASGRTFLIRLPGLKKLDPSAIAVMSLDEAERLAPPRPAPAAPPQRRAAPATLTGEGLYPTMAQPGPGGHKSRPRKMVFTHAHNWYREGPPIERFFDMSNPESELAVTLQPGTGGAIYAIRLNETTGNGETSDLHRSIILAQTAPGTPHLNTGLLAQWVGARLGTESFRAIAWIWLGNEGHYTDAKTGKRRAFGSINDSPALAIHGQIAGSIANER